MSKCIEQWNRVNRWFTRIQEQPPHDTSTYDDFYWAFFQNCWHLKEWIRYDPSLPAKTRNSIVSQADSTQSLLICADLANGSKHLYLGNPRVGSGAMHSHRVLSVVAGDLSQTRIEYFIALDDGSRLSALDVARESMKAWKRILLEHDVVI